jgi:hypothetical protein
VLGAVDVAVVDEGLQVALQAAGAAVEALPRMTATLRPASMSESVTVHSLVPFSRGGERSKGAPYPSLGASSMTMPA